MAKTAAATTDEPTKQSTADEPEAPSERNLPKVSPDMITINAQGFAWRDIMVRMPADAIADDLKSLGIWRNVQHSTNRLFEDDHLYLKAWDRSWAAEAIVAHANLEGVTLGTFKVIKLYERTKPFFSDETYRVVLRGNGFAVERIKDGQVMSDIVQNEKIAERALFDLYPTTPVSEAGQAADRRE